MANIFNRGTGGGAPRISPWSAWRLGMDKDQANDTLKRAGCAHCSSFMIFGKFLCLGVLIVFPAAMIGMGAYYFNDCPLCPIIPIFLIALALNKHNRYKATRNFKTIAHSSKDTIRKQRTFITLFRLPSCGECFCNLEVTPVQCPARAIWILGYVVQIFAYQLGAYGIIETVIFFLRDCMFCERCGFPLLIWELAKIVAFGFFAWGSSTIFSKYEPNYDRSRGKYCDKTLYLFAFSVNIILWALVGLFLLICVFLILILACAKTDRLSGRPAQRTQT